MDFIPLPCCIVKCMLVDARQIPCPVSQQIYAITKNIKAY
jgi:hypothetical protein